MWFETVSDHPGAKISRRCELMRRYYHDKTTPEHNESAAYLNEQGLITRCLIRDDEGLATLATGKSSALDGKPLPSKANFYLCRLTLAWEPYIKSEECQHRHRQSAGYRSSQSNSADNVQPRGLQRAHHRLCARHHKDRRRRRLCFISNIQLFAVEG